MMQKEKKPQNHPLEDMLSKERALDRIQKTGKVTALFTFEADWQNIAMFVDFPLPVFSEMMRRIANAPHEGFYLEDSKTAGSLLHHVDYEYFIFDSSEVMTESIQEAIPPMDSEAAVNKCFYDAFHESFQTSLPMWEDSAWVIELLNKAMPEVSRKEAVNLDLVCDPLLGKVFKKSMAKASSDHSTHIKKETAWGGLSAIWKSKSKSLHLLLCADALYNTVIMHALSLQAIESLCALASHLDTLHSQQLLLENVLLSE